MKTNLHITFCFIILHSCFCLFSHAQGTAFTYQGRLTDPAGPLNGAAELQFTLWDSLSNGNQVAVSTPASVIVNVTNGLFTAPVDFGSGAFSGQNRWLQIQVRTTIAPFTTLSPRQSLTPAPYALYSATAATVTSPIPDSLLSANIARLQSSPVFTGTVSATSFQGSGAALTGINHLDSSGNGATGALTVDALGRVAIGTNDSGAALQVAGGGLYANPIFRNAVTNNPSGAPHMSSPINVFVSGTRAYVTSYTPGSVEIFDISTPLQPVFLGEAVDDSINASSPFKKLSGASGIFVTNNIAFVTAETENSFTIMDVSNPANPTKLAELVNGVGGVTNLDTPTGVLVSGDKAFVLGFISSSLSIFNVSNPANPTLIKQIRDDSAQPGSPFTKLQWPYQMSLVGTKLYIAARGDHAVTILDVANPANPTLVAEIVDATVNPMSPFTRLRNANWVEVVNNIAYVAAGAFSSTLGSLTLIDVSNPANPVKLAEINDDVVQTNTPFKKMAGAWGVSVAGNTAFVTCFAEDAVTAIDVSDPTRPRLLKEIVNGADGINTLRFTEGLAVIGGTLYVVGDSSGALNAFSIYSALGLKVDGFVGIGTATPRTALDVAGTVSSSAMELGDSTSSNSTPYIDFHFGTSSNQDYNVRLINDAANQLSVLGNFAVTRGLVVDSTGVNAGTLSPGLIFGSASGEGISSKRTAGVGQFGLDFYTAFQNRMSIANNGGVGIGTSNPQSRLHLAGAQDALQLSGFQPFLTFVDTGNANVRSRIQGVGGDLVLVTESYLSGANSSSFVDVRNTGFVGIGTASPSQKLHVIGNILASGTITPNSDRNAKTDFAPVDSVAVLNRVARLPIQQWRFKAEAEDVKHIGPMAQDFRAAFGLGEIPTAIATVDADGVALAAIQGLNEKVEVGSQRSEVHIQKLAAENAALWRQNESLEQRLEALEKIIRRQNQIEGTQP